MEPTKYGSGLQTDAAEYERIQVLFTLGFRFLYTASNVNAHQFSETHMGYIFIVFLCAIIYDVVYNSSS